MQLLRKLSRLSTGQRAYLPSHYSVKLTLIHKNRAEWNFNVFPSTDLPSGYLLLAPRGSDVETPTGIIYTNDGEVVMYGKEFGIGQTMSFSVGTYQGNQVITTWGGQFYGNGYGNGFGLIYDQNYNLVANM